MNILINVLLAIDMLVALLMTLVILMQRPKSEGLGAAFGGGVTENIFGAQTTNVLVKFTGWLAGIFFVLTFLLSVLYAQQGSSDSALHKQLMGMPAPAPAATASPAAAAGSPAASTAPSASAGPAAPNVSPAAPNATASPAAANVSPAAPVKALDVAPEATMAPPPPAAPTASP
jgi:preprotein translocase subunit SecG